MRKYGIEIEATLEGGRSGSGIDRVLNEIRTRGLRVIDRRHTHLGSSATEWTVKYDGTVDGVEVVSPHLDFDNEADRAQVDTIMEALQAAGANTDRTAGIHVHVECADFTPKQVAAVCRFAYKFEDAIFRIASSGWRTHRGTRWCKPIPESVATDVMKVRDAAALRSRWNDRVDRYMMVNLHAWYLHGTLEFRVFNSTLNAKRAQAYIALAVTIVDDARKGYSRSVKKHYPLGYMATDPTGAKAKSLRLRLCQILKYESGMTEADWKLILFCWNDSNSQAANLARYG